MSFDGINNIKDLLKRATVTVLLEKIHFDKIEGCSVVPVQCPAAFDGKEGLIFNSENKPVCVKGTVDCPYFLAATFDINGYLKEIQCKAR